MPTPNEQCSISVPTDSTVSADSGSINIEITTNGDSSWTASESCSWVSISPDSGIGNGDVTVTYLQNISGSSRSCTITFSCGSSSDTYTLNQNITTGINEIDIINNILIYPNPNSGEFTTKIYLPKPQDCEILIVNLAGRVIYKEKLKAVSGNYQKTIDLKNNSKGIYIIELITKEKTIRNKIIIQ
jgi:hypothetical protein